MFCFYHRSWLRSLRSEIHSPDPTERIRTWLVSIKAAELGCYRETRRWFVSPEWGRSRRGASFRHMMVRELELFTESISVAVGTETPLLNIWQEVDVYVTDTHAQSSFGAQFQLDNQKEFSKYWDRKHFVSQRDSVSDLWRSVDRRSECPWRYKEPCLVASSEVRGFLKAFVKNWRQK